MERVREVERSRDGEHDRRPRSRTWMSGENELQNHNSLLGSDLLLCYDLNISTSSLRIYENRIDHYGRLDNAAI